MNNSKYNLAFVGGALLHRESVLIAKQYQAIKNWDSVSIKVEKENLLQTRTISTSKRISRETILRLRELTPEEVERFVSSNENEQIVLLWLAICRRYRFIAEFAKEVIHEHFLNLNQKIDYEDFDAFFNNKAEWHSELESITEMTKNKLRQVLFRMLREADFITKDNEINAMIISPMQIEKISTNSRDELLLFPISDSASSVSSV